MKDVYDEHVLDARAKLLRDDWIVEIDGGLDHLRPVIMNELGLSGFGGIFNPVIEFSAKSFLRSSRRDGIRQLNITLRCAKHGLLTGDIDESIKKNFKPFRELDSIYRYAKKNHLMYQKTTDLLEEEFSDRARDSANLLAARPGNGITSVISSGDMFKIAYGNDIGKAIAVQERYLELIQARVGIVREHESLLYVPFGLREKVLAIVDAGISYTRSRYKDILRRYFS